MALPIPLIIAGAKFFFDRMKKAPKSKTVVGNTIAGAIVTYFTSQGIEIPVELVVWILAGVNIFLRYITKKPILEK